MKITFLGAAGEVTGSNYLLEEEKTKILVDCGLFQSGLFCDNKNYEKFQFDPKSISALILTHAHIDHIGRVPLLVKHGFRGKIYATPATLDFSKVLLEDSVGLLEREAHYCGTDIIYNKEDVIKAFSLFEVVEYDRKIKISDDFSFILRDAGHILGSAIIEIIYNAGKKIVFSGDLGNWPNPMLKAPFDISETDYLVSEATYGDRLHENVENRKDILEDVIEETADRGGALLIPAFAMERTQELLFDINELVENGRIPQMPIFVDSPLAIKVTDIYKKYEKYYNFDLKKQIKSGDDIFKFPGLIFTESVEESKKINSVNPPKIIIAGSGMSQGGRIMHHERLYLSNPKNTILIIGYQVKGSLGRKLLEGAKQVKIFDEMIEARAQIKTINGYSAHADQARLMDWINPMRGTLKKVFLTHSENDSAKILGRKIMDEFAIEAIVPELGDSFELIGD